MGTCQNGMLMEMCVECRRITVAKRRGKTIKSRKKQQAAWRTRNIDKIREKDRLRSAKRYAKHPKEIKDRNKRWWKNNPVRAKVYKAAYRARKLKAPGHYDSSDVLKLIAEQDGVCAAPFCYNDIIHGGHVDHIIALSRGGSNWPENLQMLCKSCNSSKGTKLYEDWIIEKASSYAR